MSQNALHVIEELRRFNEEHGGIDCYTVRAVYLYGSRLFGKSDEHSDYDLIIVIDLPDKTSTSELAFVLDVNQTLELRGGGWHMDCVIIDVEQYINLTHNYKVILTLWMPQSFVWFEHESLKTIRTEWISQYNISLRAVQRNLALWCYTTARRSWFDNDKRRAKKNLVHGIRYLLFAHQIVDQGSITDYEAASPFYDVVFKSDSEDWDYYEDLYKPYYNQLKKSLNDKIFSIIESFRPTFCYGSRSEYMKSISLVQKPFAVSFIHEHGLSNICRCFDICVQPVTNVQCPDGKQLIKLTRLSTMRKYEWSVVRECSGVIIEKNQDDDHDAKLVCLPLLKIVQFWQNEADQIEGNLDGITLTKKHDGISCCLYYYNNKWNLSHHKQQDEWNKSVCSSTLDTFEHVFWNAWSALGYQLPSADHYNRTFVFQFIQVDSDIRIVGVQNITMLREEDILSFANRYGWRGPDQIPIPANIKPPERKKMNIKDQSKRPAPLDIFVNVHHNKNLIPLYDLVNNLVEFNPLLVKGLVCRDEKFNRVSIESAIHFYGPQLLPFFEVVDGTLTEAANSWHNDSCMVEIARGVMSSTLHDDYFDSIPLVLCKYQPSHQSLYVNKYLSMKQVLTKLCDEYDQWFLVLSNKCVLKKDGFIDKKELNKAVKESKDYPFKKSHVLFLMCDNKLSTARQALQRFYSIDTKLACKMYDENNSEE